LFSLIYLNETDFKIILFAHIHNKHV